MAMTFATGLTTLDTILGDSTNVTFTTGEKTRALTKAWNDPYVVNEVFDTSLTFSSGTYQYTIPATISSIQDIYLSPTGSSNPFPDPIDADLWHEVNGKINFTSQAPRVIPHGYTLYIQGHYKLATSDSIANTDMQEYVLALAGVETLKLLTHKKANLFTKNDVTMSELIGLRRELQQDVINLRKSLRRTWESA